MNGEPLREQDCFRWGRPGRWGRLRQQEPFAEDKGDYGDVESSGWLVVTSALIKWMSKRGKRE
ncbi:hypothetical protein GCM10007416_03530 [Kroppenstedtia guangzhouensis]|uniref:Uncharacterized protein n=1 Tax=Kroppenstedtia guangzhouensis TaxID=1274356 RepID=A0ABQ1G085_9BACL|nr:hypothetical protein GCM10007416_03530 [Kroppenstedtia guangzhouensis]